MRTVKSFTKKLVYPLLALSLYSTSAFADEEQGKGPSLEEQLESLSLPANKAPNNVSKERLYSIQTRVNPLSKRHEIGYMAGMNLASPDYVNSTQYGVSYRYHFNDKWALGVTGIVYNNELDNDGDYLLEKGEVLPDFDYPDYQYDLTAEYNLFYGKFRLGIDTVFYFDQYWSFGAGMIQKQSGLAPMGILEGGFAFWFGKSVAARLGFRNQYFQEETLVENRLNHDLVTHLTLSYLFGGQK
ncbi:MAG: outer membrane beta-barrel domain-containing protein [Bacteriovoracaceae bacterium]